MEGQRSYILREKAEAFALRIVKLYKYCRIMVNE